MTLVVRQSEASVASASGAKVNETFAPQMHRKFSIEKLKHSWSIKNCQGRVKGPKNGLTKISQYSDTASEGRECVFKIAHYLCPLTTLAYLG